MDVRIFLFFTKCATEDSTLWKKIRINAERHLNTAFEANDIIDRLEMQLSISTVLADSTLFKDLGGLQFSLGEYYSPNRRPQVLTLIFYYH